MLGQDFKNLVYQEQQCFAAMTFLKVGYFIWGQPVHNLTVLWLYQLNHEEDNFSFIRCRSVPSPLTCSLTAVFLDIQLDHFMVTLPG